MYNIQYAIYYCGVNTTTKREMYEYEYEKYHARLMCHKNLEILRLYQKTKLMVKFIEVLVVFIRQTKVITYQKQKICTLN